MPESLCRGVREGARAAAISVVCRHADGATLSRTWDKQSGTGPILRTIKVRRQRHPSVVALQGVASDGRANGSFQVILVTRPTVWNSPTAALRRGSESRWRSFARGRLAKMLTATFDHLLRRRDRWKANPGHGQASPKCVPGRLRAICSSSLKQLKEWSRFAKGLRGAGPLHPRQGQETVPGHPCDRSPSSQVAVSVQVNHSRGEGPHVDGVCTTDPHARDAVARASQTQGTARPARRPRTPGPDGRSRCRANRRWHDAA